MRIALTGNPNSGKTTMYNALTGRNEKVGNWAGVTVERKEHRIKKSYYKGNEELIAVDLPGAYSMSPFTSEESITSSYVKKENPDVIINIVDADNLSRSLFFTTQLLELGIPVVVALNKSDITEKKGTKIDVVKLSEKLACPVIETVSTSASGLQTVIEAAVKQIRKSQTAVYSQGNVDLTSKEAVETADRKRFEFVNKIVKDVETRKVLTKNKNFGDKIDAVLTNKWLGIPIFAVVMFLVFHISQAEGPLGLGKWLEGILAGAVEAFQGYIGELLSEAHPLLQAIIVDGIIGGVAAVVGFLPLVMVMYFLIALFISSDRASVPSTSGRRTSSRVMPIAVVMHLTPVGLPSLKRSAMGSVSCSMVRSASAKLPSMASCTHLQKRSGKAFAATEITPMPPRLTSSTVMPSSPEITRKSSGLPSIISCICSMLPQASLTATILLLACARRSVVWAVILRPVRPGTL